MLKIDIILEQTKKKYKHQPYLNKYNKLSISIIVVKEVSLSNNFDKLEILVFINKFNNLLYQS